MLRLIEDLLAPAAPPERAVHGSRAAPRVRPHGGSSGARLVFLVSDFISVPGWERSLELLNRRHEVLAVRLVDPREIDLPDVGPVLMDDAETGEQLYVDTGDAGLPAPVPRPPPTSARRGSRRRSARAGVDAVTLSTDEDLVRAIVRMAMERRLRRAEAGMTFLWPFMLLTIGLVPLFILAARRIEAGRRRKLAALGGVGRLGATAGGGAGGTGGAGSTARRTGFAGGTTADRVAAVLIIAALVLFAIALARPQATVALPRVEGTIMLAFDVSGSMAATTSSRPGWRPPRRRRRRSSTASRRAS